MLQYGFLGIIDTRILDWQKFKISPGCNVRDLTGIHHKREETSFTISIYTPAVAWARKLSEVNRSGPFISMEDIWLHSPGAVTVVAAHHVEKDDTDKSALWLCNRAGKSPVWFRPIHILLLQWLLRFVCLRLSIANNFKAKPLQSGSN